MGKLKFEKCFLIKNLSNNKFYKGTDINGKPSFIENELFAQVFWDEEDIPYMIDKLLDHSSIELDTLFEQVTIFRRIESL